MLAQHLMTVPPVRLFGAAHRLGRLFLVEPLDAPTALAALAAPLEPRLLDGPLTTRGALAIVKKRCAAVGLPADICNHSFRATGITMHQDAGGDIEAARQLAGHASVKTTQLYNRSGDRKKRAEVERVQI